MSNLHALKTELLKPSVLKEGHLLKLGRSKLKLPKLHYYVLKPCGVYCFGTQEHDVPHGYIPLEPIEDISLSLGTVVEASTRLHCIKISDKRKAHVLACHSMEIRNSWITAILTAVAQNLVYENDAELLRKRFDSSCSNSDEFDSAFCDVQCQFTSPFWASNEAKRRAKTKRLSVAEGVGISKPTWLTKSKKKSLRSKSLSYEDIHTIYTVAEAKAPLARKRSLHDLTRYFFPSSSSKTDSDADGAKLRVHDTTQAKQNGGRKRWSLFAAMPSFGGNLQCSDDSLARGCKKICTAVKYESRNNKRGSPLIFDTKL